MDKIELKQIKKQILENQRTQKETKQKKEIQQVNDIHDQGIFREAMTGVSPLQHDKIHHDNSKPKAKRMELDDETLEINDSLSDQLDVEEIDSEEILSYCANGIQNNVFRKLRSGGYRISDELDLHGSTIKQAKQILLYYLQEAVQFENCCIRIIHGKGHRSGDNKPVLKTYVNHWLSEHERVLAFHTTKPRDGGAGAVYVLLKRNYN